MATRKVVGVALRLHTTILDIAADVATGTVYSIVSVAADGVDCALNNAID